LSSWVIVIGPPDAVKGPTVPATGGITSSMPEAGMGLGSAASKAMEPVEIELGVAPLASTAAVAVPTMSVLPRAAAADAIAFGMPTWVW
jgi:hypothetical protein